MRGYFGKDASRAQLGSGVGLSTAGIPLYVSRSLEQIQQANEVLGVITIKKTSEPSLVQICCAIWTHRETTNLSCYLACRDNKPTAVLTPKRHQIWCTTQTHRKTANLSCHSASCKSSQRRRAHWRLPLPDPCSAAAKRCGLTSSSAVCAGPPSPSPGASAPGPPCGAAAAGTGAPSCAAFHRPASARKNNTHSHVNQGPAWRPAQAAGSSR